MKTGQNERKKVVNEGLGENEAALLPGSFVSYRKSIRSLTPGGSILRKTIFIGGDTCDFLKKSGKILYAGVSEQDSCLAGGIPVIQQQGFGEFETFQLEIIVEVFAGFELQQVGEIKRRQTEVCGTPAGGRQMTVTETARQDILTEKRFHLADHLFVRFLPGDELAFVEAGTVIQK